MASSNDIIKQAKKEYNAAKQKGDKKAMVQAHAKADRARGGYSKTVVENGKYVQKELAKMGANAASGQLLKQTQALNTTPVIQKQTPVASTFRNAPAETKITPTPKTQMVNVTLPMGKTIQVESNIPKKNVLEEAFDPTENYIDKFKQGNIGGGVANFVGTGLTAAQTLYLNAANSADSLTRGEGLQKFQPQMGFANYDKAIAERRGEIPTIEKASKINPLLGKAYGFVGEVGTDPLELTPAGYLNDIKLAKGFNQNSQAYLQALQKGKLTPTIQAATQGVSKNVSAPLPRALPKVSIEKPTQAKNPLTRAELLPKSSVAPISKPIEQTTAKPEGLFVDYYPEKRANDVTVSNDYHSITKEAGYNPEDYITVYRGAPINQQAINNGDWVTTNEQLAKDYAGNGKIIKDKIQAKNLYAPKGEGIDELIYSKSGASDTQNAAIQPVKPTLQPTIQPEIKTAQNYNKALYHTAISEYDKTVKSVADYISSYKPKGTDIGIIPKNGDPLMRDGGVRYSASKNDIWYQDFYKANGRKPNKSESVDIADKLVKESLKHGNGEFFNPELKKLMDEIKNAQNVGLPQAISSPEIKPIQNMALGKSLNDAVVIDDKGKLVRGFSQNVATDQFTNTDIRKSFSDSPEIYNKLSNTDTLARADKMFLTDGARESYDTIMKAVASNTLKPEHVPLARKVANQLAKEGDVLGARNILSEIAVKQTESGQFSQAAAILRNSDPMAVMQFIDKTLKKTNDELSKRIKGFEGLKLTDEEIQRLANIDVGDEEAIKNAVSDIGKRLAKEIPSTWFEKFDELRRIAMLGNFKTQIRNVVGNIPLALERKLSNKTSALLQRTIPNVESGKLRLGLPKEMRTQALINTKSSKKIASQLYQNDKEWLLNSNKWDTNDLRKILSEERQIFKPGLVGNTAKALGAKGTPLSIANNIGIEGFRNLVYGSLQTGDVPFLKSAYTDRMASYISAQGYKTLEEVPQKALDTAREEALKATFRDTNGAAKAINSLKHKGGVLGKITEATVPFVTTPTNLVRRTIDYSPAGLIRSFVKMRKAEDVPKVIDEMAQGLTGTGLILLGAFYAKNGILVGAADTNKTKANYEKSIGKLPFSVQTPLGSVTYDWAQPVGSQLAIAAEMYKGYKKAMDEKGTFTFSDFTDAALKSGYAGIDVVLQASVYQNILDLFNGYGSPGERIVQNLKEYPLQIVPTALGQVARANDPYVRNAFDKTNEGASYKNTVISKIPNLAKTLPIKYDVWGRPVQRVQGENQRKAQEFLNPANVSAKNQTPLDKEIISLYDKTGSNDVFPKTAPYSFKVDGVQYDMNNVDVSEYQKIMGQYSQTKVGELFNSGKYKKMSDTEKLKALNGIYSDASEKARMNYLKTKGISPVSVLSASQQENYSTLAPFGIKEDQFINTYDATKDVKGTPNPDKPDKTIYLSESFNKKLAIDKANPNATRAQLMALYNAFDVSEKVW